MKYFQIFVVIFAVVLIGCKPDNDNRVLVFTKTAGYVHTSIPAAYSDIKSICRQNGILTDSTSDAAAFNDDNLSRYDAVVFLNTSGDVLDENQQESFKKFIQSGKGFVGIHGACTTEYDWPWFGGLVGNYFDQHPEIQPAVIRIVEHDHISTRHLPLEWQRSDEWYNFRKPLAAGLTILAVIDESTYEGGTNGENHPFTWCHEYDGGRAWYTAGGHAEEHYKDPMFIQHVLGGIKYVVD